MPIGGEYGRLGSGSGVRTRRRATRRALSVDVGEDGAGHLLEQLLNDRPLEVRIAGALALGRVGVPGGSAVLLACLAGEEPIKLRDAAEHALAQISARNSTTWGAS